MTNDTQSQNGNEPSSLSKQNCFSDDQLLRIEQVAEITTLSKSCISLWAIQGRFPKALTLSPTVKVWQMKCIRNWINSHAKASQDNT